MNQYWKIGVFLDLFIKFITNYNIIKYTDHKSVCNFSCNKTKHKSVEYRLGVVHRLNKP